MQVVVLIALFLFNVPQPVPIPYGSSRMRTQDKPAFSSDYLHGNRTTVTNPAAFAALGYSFRHSPSGQVPCSSGR